MEEQEDINEEPSLWLAPLNSHPNFYTHIIANQPYIRDVHHPKLVEPIFTIRITVMVKFYPEENSAEKQEFLGLSLVQSHNIPFQHFTRLPGNVGHVILGLIYLMEIDFELKNIFLERKHFDEGGDINWEDEDVYGVTEKIWYFMLAMGNKSCNVGPNHLPLQLQITKVIRIPSSLFNEWNDWHHTKKMANPNFEREFMEAIRRPRTMRELIQHVIIEQVVPLESLIEGLEVMKHGETTSSSTSPPVDEPVNCGVCLEKIEFGSATCRLPCSHVFHKQCAIRWLQEMHMCPLCRLKFPFNIGESCRQEEHGDA